MCASPSQLRTWGHTSLQSGQDHTGTTQRHALLKSFRALQLQQIKGHTGVLAQGPTGGPSVVAHLPFWAPQGSQILRLVPLSRRVTGLVPSRGEGGKRTDWGPRLCPMGQLAELLAALFLL